MIIRIAVLTVILSSLCTAALACGDSLFRVGQGVSYRVYTAPLPGSVLVYGQTEGGKILAEALAQSGHGVLLVQSEDELQTELEKGGYDVVIAPYSDHLSVESTTSATTNSEAVYLPVALSNEEERQAEQSYAQVMNAENDEIKHYLKAIHKTLKAKL
jgi:hypothetical protein